MSTPRIEEKKIPLDPMLFIDKKDKTMNSHKMQKMLKKIGTKNRLTEIQKMLFQIKEQKKLDKKLKANNISQKDLKKNSEYDDPNSLTRRASHQTERFSLGNIKNLVIQSEEIEKNLENDDFDMKKISAVQTIDQARNYLNAKRPGKFDFKTLITQPVDDNPANIFKEFKKNSPLFTEPTKNEKNSENNKREENFIMNYSRSNNLKKSIINKRRNETISQRVTSQKLPEVFFQNNYNKTNANMKPITEFSNNISRIESDRRDSFNTLRGENLLKLRPIPEYKREKNAIKHLKTKNNEINDYIKNLKDNKMKKAMDLLKLSLCNEDQQEKSTGFKNNINFGYVGYLLKSDYFEKQEKKEYLNNNNQYPNKKFFFFKPGGSNSRKDSLAQLAPNSTQQKKKISNFHEYLYQMDSCASPNTLGKNIRDFSNFLKNQNEQEKQRNLLDYMQEFVRNEAKGFYNSNMNWKNNQGFVGKETQKEFDESSAVKKEIFQFYYDLTDFHEKEAEIKQFKSDIKSSFKEYDENFKKIINDLVKYNDHLRKIDNEKRTFTYEE